MNATEKATPGPWLYDEPDNWHGVAFRVCTDKHEPIAQVQISGWPKRTARRHAALIAAAPCLLEALKEIVSRNEIQNWFDLTQARVAIAKAEVS